MPLSLSILLLLPLLATAQECDPASQTPFEVEVTADDITPFVTLTPPPSCEGFEIMELLACQADINVKEGCCSTACQDMLAKVQRDCFVDITALGCDEGAASLIPYLDSLVARCVEGETLPLACDSTLARVELTQAEVCSEERVEADEPADITALLPLASMELPASCTGFAVTDLLGCQSEINIVEGCCEENCKTVFEPVSRECMEDIGYLICTSDIPDAFDILNRVAQRCHDDPSSLTCEELIAQGPPVALGPAEESIDEQMAVDAPAIADDPPASTDDGPSFFGTSEPAEVITDDEESFFGIPSPSEEADSESFFGTDTEPSSCNNKDIDENVDVGKILEVLSTADDSKCPGFGSDTFKCSSDITLLGDTGCCESECRSFMEGLTDDCIDEVLRVSCIQSEFDTHAIFERTAKRCISDYVPRTCEDLNSKNSATQLTIIGSVFGGVLLAAMLLI